MQDFQDIEKKSAISDFISEKFVMSYPCVSPFMIILFYFHGPAILLSS